jgi:hypothetical protein
MFATCDERLLCCHMLGLENLRKVGSGRCMDAARHHKIDLDIFILVKDRSYRLDPMMNCGFGSAVLGDCCARVMADHTACHYNRPLWSILLALQVASGKGRGTDEQQHRQQSQLFD